MKINEYIDHTILKADATEEEIIKICTEAKQYEFAAVCVNPYNISLIRSELKGSNVKSCAVIGFPLGANTKTIKALETKDAILNGAQEIDMVINIGALKDKKYDVVEEDIKAVVEEAKGKAIVKVIIECCLLEDNEKVKACQIASKAGVDFVKTSTGFSSGGAVSKDVKLMHSNINTNIMVKAAGSIRDYSTAISMIEAGASRIGTSSGISIVMEASKK